MNQAHIITHANTAAVTQATDMRNTKSTTNKVPAVTATTTAKLPSSA
jgi:hypothetical protein